MRSPLSALPWLLLLGFPLFELGAHAWTRAHVPRHADYEAAAAFVRAEFQPGDLIAAAPDWTDPIVREVLGDRIDLAMAGRSDSAGYERLWAIAIRGAKPPEAAEAKPSAATLQRGFGEVTVTRWQLGPSPVLFHFAAHAREAQVALVGPDGVRPCGLRRHAAAPGGGLGAGAIPPRDRVACEGANPGTWVAPVVLEDLWLRPRYCVFQPVAKPAPLRVSFNDVPLGDELVFYGGLYYEDERMRRGADIEALVRVDGHEIANMLHRDGEGWKKLVVPTGRGRARVEVEVRGDDDSKRRFCWDATTRSHPDRSAR